MAKKNNKTCIVCGQKYTFCPTCSETKELEMWRNIYCSENCKKLFRAASGYHSQTATIEEVRARFDECDLSYKDKLNENFIDAINAAYVIKKEVEIEEEENVISINVELEPMVEEIEVIEKTKYKTTKKK